MVYYFFFPSQKTKTAEEEAYELMVQGMFNIGGGCLKDSWHFISGFVFKNACCATNSGVIGVGAAEFS